MDENKEVTQEQSGTAGTQETTVPENGATQSQTEGTATEPSVLDDEAVEEQATGAEGEGAE